MPHSLPDTDEALLVLLPTMLEQLVVVVEPPLAEPTRRMLRFEMLVKLRSFPPPAVPSARVVRGRNVEEFVLMGEDALVGAAEVAHRRRVSRADMAFEVRPAGEDLGARFGTTRERRRGSVGTVGVGNGRRGDGVRSGGGGGGEVRLEGAVEAEEGEGIVELSAGLEEEAELRWDESVSTGK
jgi:hypothetical protein